IVLGKLAARLVPVLGLVACSLPVLALGGLLGGLDPTWVTEATLVTLGVSVFGCTLALTLSIWGTRAHEVLLVTYAAWALWLLAVPAWWGYRLLVGGGWAPPTWLEKANPAWLVFAPMVRP